jgi:hypothetical protein
MNRSFGFCCLLCFRTSCSITSGFASPFHSLLLLLLSIFIVVERFVEMHKYASDVRGRKMGEICNVLKRATFVTINR